MKRATETDLVRACLELLRLRRCYVWRNNTTGVRRTDKSGRAFWAFHGTRGVADIVGVTPPGMGGRILCVECKSGRGRPSAEQEAFAAAIRDAGGLHFTVWSLADLEELLTEAGV